MKKLLMTLVLMPPMVLADTWTDPETGITWKYYIRDGKSSVVEGATPAVGAMTIPSKLGGCPVTSIGNNAFEGCTGLTSVTLPLNVEEITFCAFYNCSGLKEVTIPPSVTYMGSGAFAGCCGLTSVTIPSNMTTVVVNYILNSAQPQFALPASSDTGFVNIITEVKGNNVAIPATWANEYPNFVSRYGSDFTKALTMKSGKKDGAGNEMLVWQDYVAGTDPTNEKDVFTASITIVDGKVTISYTPELDDARKAMRKYTTWGKTSQMDTDWTEVQEGHEAEYNFFKVSVEMR